MQTLISLFLLQVVPSGTTFSCTPIAVWDGDGPIWCAEGPKVRLAGVAARELDGSCRSNHPCPIPSGIEARDFLVEQLGGRKGRWSTGHIEVNAPTMSCRSDGSAGGSRTAAWCVTYQGHDLNCVMIQGPALRWPQYWRDHRC